MPYTPKQRAMFNARAKKDPKFRALAEEANAMAGAAKKKMGTAKTRTGKAPMPKKAVAKKSVPPMPKGAGPTGGFGGGTNRSGEGGSGY